MEKGQRKDCVVVGGSLGGLMHAIALKQLGHNVRVVDESPFEVREAQAAGIFCGPYVNEFCQYHGIDIDSIGILRSGMQTLDKDCKVTGKYPHSSHYTSWSVVYHMFRAHFDRYTSKTCPIPLPAERPQDGAAIYIAGKRVYNTRYSPETGKQTVYFTDVNSNEDDSLEADLVIAADGGNSIIREKKTGGKAADERKYAGYIAWRTTLPESEMTKETIEYFKKDVSLIAVTPDSYQVIYIIPHDTGNTTAGGRSLNWMWYRQVKHHSDAWNDTMTDVDGHLHATTLSIGKVRPDVWSRMKQYCDSLPLCPPLAEIISKIPTPLITAISDRDPPKVCPIFDNGTLYLVGEAFSLPRPHSASSTNQAAWHAMNLVRVEKGEIDHKEWEARARYYADYNNCWSKFLGSKLMLGFNQTAYWGLRFLYARCYGKFWGYNN